MLDILIGFKTKSKPLATWNRLSDAPVNGVSNSNLVVVGDYVYDLFPLIDGAKTNEVHRLHVKNNQWEVIDTTDRPDKRTSHTACLIGNFIYIYGGLNESNQTISDVWRLDLTTFAWEFATVGEASYGHRSFNYNESLFVVGGLGPLSRQTIRVYHPDTDNWTYGASASLNVYNHAIAVQGSRIYIHGGSGVRTDNIRSYDIEGDFFTNHGLLNVPRFGHSLEIIDDVFYVYGGRISNPDNRFEVGDLPRKLVITEGSPPNREFVGSTVYNKGIIYVGGTIEEPTNEVWYYKP